MESLNFESEPGNDREKSKDKDTAPSKRVSLPASALHGLGHEGAKMPKLESVFDANQRQQEMLFHAAQSKEAKKTEDDEEKDVDEAPSPPVAEEVTPEEAVDLPLQHLVKEFAPAPAEKSPEVPLTPEEAEKFNQIVEIDLHDLRDLNLKPSEHEPKSLNQPIAELLNEVPLEGEVPLQTPPPRREAVPDSAADLAAWEKEMETEDVPEFPAATPLAATAIPTPKAQSSIPPNPNVPSWHPESSGYDPNQPPTPPAQSGTGGGGGRPPFPPPVSPIPGSGGGPNPNFNASPMAYNPNTAPAINPNVLSNHNLMTPAALAYLNAKVNYLDLKRRRGDAIVGTVAGWALVRTFRNRGMIKRNARETSKRLKEQAVVSTKLEQQNNLLQQRLNQVEQRPAPTAAPERVAAPVAAVAATERGQKSHEEEAAEKVRLIHEQQEKALRQQELAVPPEHHVERPGWLSIEVDNKTGKAVEKPTTFEYGKAFNEERRHEQLQDKVKDAATQDQAGGQATGHAGPGITQFPPVPHSPTLPPPPPDQSQHIKRSPMQQVSATASDPWVWAGVGFLILVFFLATVI